MKALIFLTLITFIAQVAGKIQFKGRSPAQEASLVASADVIFKVKVLLSKKEVAREKTISETQFQLRFGGGDPLDWRTGTMAGRNNPASRAFRFSLDTVLPGVAGDWQWRVKATDSSGISNTSGWYSMTISGETTPTTSSPVATPPASSPVASTTAPTSSPVTSPISSPIETPVPPIAAASNAIRNLSTQAMRAKFVRLGFHDCVGGCDGCIDLANADNAGLEVPIDALAGVVNTYAVNGLTRADIWALAAMIGAETSQRNNERLNYDFQWYGRPDCDATGGLGGPDHTLPSPDFNTTGLLHFFSSEFGFDERQTAALMGAHSIGTLSQENSGFNGPNGWDRNNDELDNGYYDVLIGGNRNNPTTNFNTLFDAPNWNQRTVNNNNVPDRVQWVNNGNNRQIIMTNSDIALVRDFTDELEESTGLVDCEFKNRNACPHAAASWDAMVEFKFDNDAFLLEFRNVFMAVLHQGSGVTNPLTGCLSPPCLIGA